jgi:SNF2 family DNA or RNA helicase
MIIFAKEITVYVQWLDQEGLFVWAKDQEGDSVYAHDLKRSLFAWHESSYYGAFVPVHHWQGIEGILLSSSLVLDYFSAPEPLEHLIVHWNGEATHWLKTAAAVSKALAEGAFMPDFDRWKSGEWGWKLQKAMDGGSRYAELLLNQLMIEWTGPNGELHEEWEDVIRDHPLVLVTQKESVNWEEQEWLEAIGWRKDDAPFRLALQLTEPERDSLWQLRLVLQDRENEARLVECDAQGEPWGTDMPASWKGHTARISRELIKIFRAVPWLQSGEGMGLAPELNDEQAWRFLAEDSLRLMEQGVPVFLPAWWGKIQGLKPRLKAHVKSLGPSQSPALVGLQQIMQYDWKVAIGDLDLSEQEFRQLLEQKNRLVQIRGHWIQADFELLKRIQQTIRRADKEYGLSLPDVLEAHWLHDSSAAKIEMEVEWDESAEQVLELFLQPGRLPAIHPPASLQATLRPYQLGGVAWMLFLRRLGLGGCLADDMGLGKTIQWIAYLLYSIEKEPREKPSLLICPTSVLGNWQKELSRFAPSLKVYLHYGSGRVKGEEFAARIQGSDLVLTSYALAHLDEEELCSVTWDSLCLDEAQNVKNPYTKQATSIRKLKGQHRIALTGTPIENRLAELWSIFDFLNPGYLGSLRQFKDRFLTRIEKDSDPLATQQVQRLIRPFLLRREKADPAIALDLPEKYESKEYVPLTAEQASLYESTLKDLFQRLDQASPMERRGLILGTLTKLKQICNHPGLVMKESRMAMRKERSRKIERLLEMVDEVRQEGDRCLIFTQFVETGHFLQRMLEQERKEPVLFLHGGTPKADRDEMVSRFQDLDSSRENGIFILSLKAGGTGLNLTGANHVFHFDRWWNPAVEDQATDRAYRIGQERNVQVHKFITLGTVEERVDEMIERKQGISREIIGSGEQWISEFSTEELKDLFALRKEWIE